MIIDIPIKTTRQIDIEPEEAFKLLCATLRMDIVLVEDADVFIAKDDFGNNCVYSKHGKYDDRGDLFIALRNVAVNIFPNTLFRGADYIYKENTK